MTQEPKVIVQQGSVDELSKHPTFKAWGFPIHKSKYETAESTGTEKIGGVTVWRNPAMAKIAESHPVIKAWKFPVNSTFVEDVNETTIAQVNKALKEKGYAETLVKGKDYLYFTGGDAHSWKTASVMVPRVGVLTVEQWIDARNELASGPRADQ